MSTIVLAYSGGRASSNAIQWLAQTYSTDVVTVTLDVGQGEDLAALRARALSCGATRAHAIDARDELVREFLLPTLSSGPLGDGVYPPIDALTRPLIASKLLEVARIEGTSVVAHASHDESIDVALRALSPNVTILAPARESAMDTHPPARRVEQTLWGRMISVRDGDDAPGRGSPDRGQGLDGTCPSRHPVRKRGPGDGQRCADAAGGARRESDPHCRSARRGSPREQEPRAHARVRCASCRGSACCACGPG